MNVLITGAAGFVGKNLTAALQNIRDGKDRVHSEIKIDALYLYDADIAIELLDAYCAEADFVFHLAGVNRPQDPAEYMQDNLGFTLTLLETLKKHNNTCPIVFSSSIKAALMGGYAGDVYGKSKRAAEDLLFAYAKETGVKVMVYRFPNLFGKWCRPNYNSVVATFCYNIANDLPVTVHDRATELELLYIDDLLEEMLAALVGVEHRCALDGVRAVLQENGRFCAAPITHRVTLGEIADLLDTFKAQTTTLVMPEIPKNSFAKKLYSTYLSYLPKEKASFPLDMHADAQGSFTELLRTEKCGQCSVNILKPGITKGQHWHHSKWELFIVVSGHAVIEQRKIGTDEVLRFTVSGEKIEAVHMLPGYTHKIGNLSKTEDLVTVMWANECFDPLQPDTYTEEV